MLGRTAREVLSRSVLASSVTRDPVGLHSVCVFPSFSISRLFLSCGNQKAWVGNLVNLLVNRQVMPAAMRGEGADM